MASFFFLLIVPLIICTPFKKLHRIALWLNYLWAWGFFRMAFIPVKTIWEFEPKSSEKYILCANHFSYIDIPALGLFPKPFKFVGKSQLAKIPLFGFMYKRIHITVNRSSFKSRANSLSKAKRELANGYNIGFFPEGGIRSANFPKMERFKEGAFILSTETNTPIIPITFHNNYKILPDDEVLEMRRRTCKIIYHHPIYPNGNGNEQIKQLKQEVFRVIQSSLDKETIDS